MFFFIAQILRWIKNVVLYFISKFMNIIRRLLNKPEKELDPETLKLSFNRIKALENVRVLGPLRKYNQVEISKTGAFKLGLNPPVRDSGDLEGSSPITLEYNGKEVYLDKGCIIPTRHIHINPDEVEKFGLTGVKEVSVKVGGEKGGIFNHVRIKSANMSFFELHIDTDDANSFMIKQGDIVEIINEN